MTEARMDQKLQPIFEELEKEFGVTATETHDEVSLVLPAGKIVAACQRMHDLGFELLSALTAVDYWPEEQPRFHVIYEFTSVSKNLRLEIRLPVPGINPTVPTISHIYRNANWRERELWDMFGIKAEGHPDLRRILMPADWEGHPLRKDYPLGYEEPQFTFNFEEINLRKPYAKE
jgi:NADH-quinone oxidoreductase subunit C